MLRRLAFCRFISIRAAVVREVLAGGAKTAWARITSLKATPGGRI